MRSETGSDGRRTFIEQARRAQIIEAATETVATVGYAQASLARIAQHAGISKSVISYHFDGKDELLEIVVHQFFEDTWAFMQPRVEAAATAAKRITAWITAQLIYFGAHRTPFIAMVEIVTHHRTRDGGQPFAQAEEEGRAELARILEEGQRSGEFRGFDARSIAVVIDQALEGVLGRWVMDEAMDLDEHAATLVDFVHHAIRKEKS